MPACPKTKPPPKIPHPLKTSPLQLLPIPALPPPQPQPGHLPSLALNPAAVTPPRQLANVHPILILNKKQTPIEK